jgi:hypothetical protein
VKRPLGTPGWRPGRSYFAIVSICVGPEGPRLVMFDAQTLELLAEMPLPPRSGSGGGNPLTDFSGGGYFYLDNQDRAVVATNTRHIWVVGETSGPVGPGFTLVRDYDASSRVPVGDGIISALPDWSGRIWFASVKGVVGTVDPASGSVKSIDLAEAIGNSFAVDETGGVYIVSDRALYRFDPAADGTPAVTWSETYANTGVKKPGQTEMGSGTTPTLMGSDYVSITDNADPMDVVVYKRAKTVTGARRVCVQPVFNQGASDTDQSLIGAGRSMVVENNYGYTGVAATEQGATTTPGISRVDINDTGTGCHTVWTSAERAPSVVPKLSLVPLGSVEVDVLRMGPKFSNLILRDRQTQLSLGFSQRHPKPSPGTELPLIAPKRRHLARRVAADKRVFVNLVRHKPALFLFLRWAIVQNNE